VEERFELRDGSRVAVIGAGPAGSMFSYFFLSMTEMLGLRVDVDIYEPRKFGYCGPAGCNHCGGVVSESLVQRLATEGIRLPDDVVQRGTDSYQLHMDIGGVRIATPLMEKRIAAVYRGNGPKHSEPSEVRSFDEFLLGLAREKGASVTPRLVTDIRRHDDGLSVYCADQSYQNYDLAVIATGVNTRLTELLEKNSIEFERPVRKKTFICEFRLGRDVVRERFGPAMHVFLLDIPRLKFAALVPKVDYVTLVLLADDIDEGLISEFLNAPEVRQCFPGNAVPTNACHCYPRINIREARPAFGDRVVMIGDSGATRLFKDGIGAAFRTAKAAAKTIVFHGVDADSFRQHYAPVCRRISNDNKVGKFIFDVASLVQKSRFARRGVLRMIDREQHRPKSSKRMSGVMWDLFSGSASYTNVLLRTLHPAFIGSLVWNLAAANVPGSDLTRPEREETSHVQR
jgi:flavin-dependent dehydrogenase